MKQSNIFWSLAFTFFFSLSTHATGGPEIVIVGDDDATLSWALKTDSVLTDQKLIQKNKWVSSSRERFYLLFKRLNDQKITPAGLGLNLTFSQQSTDLESPATKAFANALNLYSQSRAMSIAKSYNPNNGDSNIYAYSPLKMFGHVMVFDNRLSTHRHFFLATEPFKRKPGVSVVVNNGEDAVEIALSQVNATPLVSSLSESVFASYLVNEEKLDVQAAQVAAKKVARCLAVDQVHHAMVNGPVKIGFDLIGKGVTIKKRQTASEISLKDAITDDLALAQLNGKIVIIGDTQKQSPKTLLPDGTEVTSPYAHAYLVARYLENWPDIKYDDCYQ